MNRKRFLCLLLAAVLVVSLSLSTFAEGPKDEPIGISEEENSETPDEDSQLPKDAWEAETPIIQSAPALLADSAEDVNYILVEKTFTDLPADQIPVGFQVTVSSDTGGVTVLNKENTLSRTTDDRGNVVWRWKITNAGTGTYTVKETGETVSHYTVKKSGEGTVEVKAAAMTVLIPVHETTCSHTNWPVRVEEDSNVLFAATLTQGGVAVISQSPLSASQREAVSQAVLKIKGPWKKPVYFYSIEEQFRNGTGFELNGATITYNAESEEVIIGQTRNWQHVATMKYRISEADNPEIALNNVYSRSAATVRIQKNVVGNMADREKSFAFSVSVKENGEDADFVLNGLPYNGNATFSLKHGESVLLEKIPVGAWLSVSEADYTEERYRPSYTLDQGETVSQNTVTILDVAEGDHILQFTNQKTVIPDTGVWLDTSPYLLLFGMAAGAFPLLLCRHGRGKNR